MHPISLIFLGLCAFLAGFWLVRLLERRQVRASEPKPTSASPALLTPPSSPVASASWSPSATIDRDIRHLILHNRKLEAIKLVREQSGWNLKQAKAYVEQRQERRSPHSLEPEVVAAAQQLMAENQKIAAIKLIRNHTGWGLKEAKDYLEKSL